MKSKAVLMALAMMTTALVGCTGDPDGSGNDEFDAATLQGMIEAGLQDFMNNTTVDITTIYYTNETSSTTNYINGSGGSSTTVHVLAGTEPGDSEVGLNYSADNIMALLVRANSYDAATAGNSAAGLDGANICVGIGTWMESQIVNYYSSVGNSFTSVPVADAAEANAKFIDGSCDALAGGLSDLEGLRTALSNDVDTWVTNGIGQMSNSSGGYSWLVGSSSLSLTISQSAGEAAALSTAYSEITITGTCVSNCTGQDDTISHTITYGLADSPFNSVIFDQPPAIVTSSTCEYEFSDDDWPGWAGTFGPYGLECELTLSMVAQFGLTSSWYPYNISNFADYEFEWGDWTYYVMWSSLPVIMHE